MKMNVYLGTLEIEAIRTAIIKFVHENADQGFPKYVVITSIDPDVNGIHFDVDFVVGFGYNRQEVSSLRLKRKTPPAFVPDYESYGLA